MNVYSHSSSNDWALNTVEYMVTKKPDASIRLKRFLIIFGALILAIVSCIFVSKVPAFGAIIILLIAFFVKFFWDYTKIEYEYTIVQGEFTMDAIIGAKKRKTLVSFMIRDAEKIAPYKNDAPRDIPLISACASPESSDTYIAIFKDEKGTRQAILFSAIDKALDIMSYYNKIAVEKA